MSANDQVLPFTIDDSPLSGRIVRLHHSIDAILTRHHYPHAVSVLLGQFMTLGVSLATALKFDGVCTLEARGNGVVPFLVADITAQGAIRGYAHIDSNKHIPDYSCIQDTLVYALMGTGHMIFTVDQMGTNARYQGIIELNQHSWEHCMEQYFEKSMQFKSVLRVACAKYPHGWISGCITIQKLPEQSQKTDTETENEYWNGAVILLQSVTDAELTDTTICPKVLLTRLYHAHPVRIYPPLLLHDTCRCNRQKMHNTLAQIPEKERGELLNADGQICVHCEYCATTQNFSPADITLQHM